MTILKDLVSSFNYLRQMPIDSRITNNHINTIEPYKLSGVQWVFDDPSKNLVAEAFVSGADQILDIVTEYADRCVATFLADYFPSCTFRLKKGEEASGGAWYSLYHADEDDPTVAGREEAIADGWLCPVTKLYFGGQLPQEIYLKVS